MSLPEPITRKEQYYDGIARGNVSKLPEPITREEQYLEYIAKNGGGGGGGTTDYEALDNKPSVNGVELSGNKTLDDLNIQGKLTFDNEPTEDSQNPVKSGGVYDALESLDEAISRKPDEYADLTDKPQINGETLSGNKTASDLGLQTELKGAQTVSGNPITITDAEAMNAQNVVVELEPTQDLHGYSKPWAGGAGKNKLNINDADKQGTASAITLTKNDDSLRIQVNGATYAGAYIELSNIANGTYYLSFSFAITEGLVCIQGFNSSSAKIYDSGTRTTSGSLLNQTITISDGYLKLIFFASWNTDTADVTYSNVMLATQADLPYSPYSNICPISGYSEVNVEVSGATHTVSLDGTKYGGILDVTEGKFIDDHGYASINYASLVDGLFREQAPNDVNWSYPSCKCSCLEVWDTVDDLADNYGISYDDGYFYMNLPPECGATESAVQTWLQNNPIDVVYITRDVTEESTTPTDIPLLENTNNVSTDGTNIQLKYQPNNVIGECKAYTDEECAKVLPSLPTTDGTYHLSCEVTSGVGVLSWVSDS